MGVTNYEMDCQHEYLLKEKIEQNYGAIFLSLLILIFIILFLKHGI